jgi:molybdopterin-binding protein
MHREDSSQSMNMLSSVWNLLAGRVISILHGLTRTTIKVMTEDAILRIRCSPERVQERSLHIGQQVVAQIHANDVLLGMAGTWPGGDRWNRWTGRIVLVDPGMSDPMITVKLQGKSCTLKSTGPVVGQTFRPEAWDAVNIVIDPEKVSLMPHQFASRTRWTSTSPRIYGNNRVWIRGRVEAVRKAESGCVISLDVGGAHISALICGDQDALCEWVPGLPVEMHVDQWDAWLRPTGEGVDAVMCKLMYDTGL